MRRTAGAVAEGAREFLQILKDVSDASRQFFGPRFGRRPKFQVLRLQCVNVETGGDRAAAGVDTAATVVARNAAVLAGSLARLWLLDDAFGVQRGLQKGQQNVVAVGGAAGEFKKSRRKGGNVQRVAATVGAVDDQNILHGNRVGFAVEMLLLLLHHIVRCHFAEAAGAVSTACRGIVAVGNVFHHRRQ